MDKTTTPPESTAQPRLPMLGSHVSRDLYAAVLLWVAQDPERSIAIFLRDAARAKLRADGIFFTDKKQRKPKQK